MRCLAELMDHHPEMPRLLERAAAQWVELPVPAEIRREPFEKRFGASEAVPSRGEKAQAPGLVGDTSEALLARVESFREPAITVQGRFGDMPHRGLAVKPAHGAIGVERHAFRVGSPADVVQAAQ